MRHISVLLITGCFVVACGSGGHDAMDGLPTGNVAGDSNATGAGS